MIDYGLLMSVIVTLAASSLAMRLRPPRTYNSPVSALDIMLLPGLVGLVVGRLSTLAIDDPRAIGQVSDMLVIRSGVEFWPGVAAAAIVIAWSGHRAQVSPIERVVDLAAHFRVPGMVIVNRYDLNVEMAETIEKLAVQRNLVVLGRVPFDPVFTRSMVQGQTLFEYGAETPTRQVVRDIWAKIISSPSMNPLGIVDFKTTIQ